VAGEDTLLSSTSIAMKAGIMMSRITNWMGCSLNWNSCNQP